MCKGNEDGGDGGGRVLAISHERDAQEIVRQLQAVDGSFSHLAFHGIYIDQTIIIEALANALPLSTKWENVELINCQGHVEMAINVIMSFDSVKSLNLVRNIETTCLEYQDEANEEQNTTANNTNDADEEQQQQAHGRFVGLGLALKTSTSLQNLRITSPMIPDDAKALGDGLACNTSLEWLEFRWSSFENNNNSHNSDDENDDDDNNHNCCIAQLASGLASNQHLRGLDLFGCALEDSEVQLVLEALQNHPTLDTLILNGNKCDALASAQVAQFLKMSSSSSSSSSCCGASTTTATTTETSTVAIKEDSSQEQESTTTTTKTTTTRNVGNKLRKLDLSFQRLVHDKTLDIGRIAPALAFAVNLQILDLTCNALVDQDAQRLADVLPCNTTLQELFLARNKFTDVGITSIAQALPHNQNLKTLSLWGNPFGEQGAEALLKGMKRNVILQDLHLFRQFACSDQIQYYTNVNRGGRRLLMLANSNSVPLGVWPLVLERTHTLQMNRRTKPEAIQRARMDMLYCLLRGGPALSAPR